MRFFGGFAFFFYLCTMIEFLTSNFVLSNRELFLVIIASVIYVVLFVVTFLNSRRKILQLRERINKVHALKEELEAQRARVRDLVPTVDPELLEEYNAIKRHISPPVSRLIHGQCSGCNTSLPSAVSSRIKGGTQVECETCGRIIIP
jgi:hypothetical protein